MEEINIDSLGRYDKPNIKPMTKTDFINKWRGNFNATEYQMFKNDIDTLLSSEQQTKDKELINETINFLKGASFEDKYDDQMGIDLAKKLEQHIQTSAVFQEPVKTQDCVIESADNILNICVNRHEGYLTNTCALEAMEEYANQFKTK